MAWFAALQGKKKRRRIPHFCVQQVNKGLDFFIVPPNAISVHVGVPDVLLYSACDKHDVGNGRQA